MRFVKGRKSEEAKKVEEGLQRYQESVENRKQLSALLKRREELERLLPTQQSIQLLEELAALDEKIDALSGFVYKPRKSEPVGA